MYTNEETLHMLLVYGECGRNAGRAVQRYGELYPDRQLPTRQLLASMCKKPVKSGNWKAEQRTRQKTATEEAHEEIVLGSALSKPHAGSRHLAKECGTFGQGMYVENTKYIIKQNGIT
ncbi:Uncharacterized protein GBIM_11961 [Gryllus bimaculatus]|nr:Uncharacterized protein GBIM_11961 [Gryllus bimaculatus]